MRLTLILAGRTPNVSAVAVYLYLGRGSESGGGGEGRYVFEDDLIEEIDQEVAAASAKQYTDWMVQHGDRLQSG